VEIAHISPVLVHPILESVLFSILVSNYFLILILLLLCTLRTAADQNTSSMEYLISMCLAVFGVVILASAPDEVR